MVIRWLAVITLCAGSSAWASLQAGRAALKADDLPGALKAYHDIGVKSAEWPDKVEDLTRYLLVKENGQEAWRMLQVAHRVNRFADSWQDLERLALYRANACPLSLPAADEARGHLLNAAVYRYMEQMFESTTATLPSDDSISVHLATGLTPYLQEIPDMQLAPQRGCRLAKMETRKKAAVLGSELSELSHYLDEGKDEQSTRLLVTMRAVELTDSLHKDKVQKKLLASLPKADQIPWAELPDPEKQWLFRRVFGAASIDKVSVEQRLRAQEIALQALFADKASPYWLAMIDLNSLPIAQRLKVLSRAEKLGDFKGRAWVLFELARTQFDAGHTPEGLTILRRLMVEGEETVEGPLEEAAVHLAARVFTKYRFEQGLQGALQASLPARLWNDLLAQSSQRAAVDGRSAEYLRLQSILHSRTHAVYNNSPEADLNKVLAQRNLGLFTKRLGDFKYSPAKLAEYTKTYAGYLLSEDSPKDLEASLKPYSQALVKRLRALIQPGSDTEDQVNELASLLDTAGGKWSRGARGVRHGVVKLGIARWTPNELRPADFVLHPPSILPRRELFYVPVADQRGWRFSTAIR
jgi:hypothetical protein